MTSEQLKPFPKTIVLVGMMGAGKSSVGRRLATRLDLPFVDADAEIEAAAGCSIADIFGFYGEDAFRDGERRVIARLLAQPPHVLATGGGAFLDFETRARIADCAVSIWLRAEPEILMRRLKRRGGRPLLEKGDREEVIRALVAERYPVYAEADITIESTDAAPENTVEQAIAALDSWLAAHPAKLEKRVSP